MKPLIIKGTAWLSKSDNFDYAKYFNWALPESLPAHGKSLVLEYG